MEVPYPRTESDEMLSLQKQIDDKHNLYQEEVQNARKEYAEYMKHLKKMGEHQKNALDTLEEIAKLLPELHEEARKPKIG